MTDERYYAKPGPIAPLALVDEWIGIWLLTQWLCYKVLHYDQIPKSRQFTQDFGAVAAGAWSGSIATGAMLDQSLTPPDAFQIRFFPLDDIEVLFAIGNADFRFKTMRQTARADITTMQVDPDLSSTEVVLLTSSSPSLNIFNPTGYNLAQSRVVFFGYTYRLDNDTLRTFKTGAEAREALRAVTLAGSGGF